MGNLSLWRGVIFVFADPSMIIVIPGFVILNRFFFHFQRILGPLAFKSNVEQEKCLPRDNKHPIYNYVLKGVITCFSGLRNKEELVKLVHCIHFMGGSIRKDLSSSITHLVCNSTTCDKYQYAITFGLPPLRQQWIRDAWARRNEANFNANTEAFMKDYRLKVFEGQKICFMGFPADEHQHMADVLRMNGGTPTELDDPECTHVVSFFCGNFSFFFLGF